MCQPRRQNHSWQVLHSSCSLLTSSACPLVQCCSRGKPFWQVSRVGPGTCVRQQSDMVAGAGYQPTRKHFLSRALVVAAYPGGHSPEHAQ